MSVIDVTVPRDSVSASKLEVRLNWVAIRDRIGTMPFDYTLKEAGTLVGVGDGLNGPTTADEITQPLRGGGRPLWDLVPRDVDVTANTSLVTNNHLYCFLICRNTSAIVLQLEKSSDPAAGVQHGFTVALLRPLTSGVVLISSTTLTNGSSIPNAKVSPGGMATLWVDGFSNLYYLKGETDP